MDAPPRDDAIRARRLAAPGSPALEMLEAGPATHEGAPLLLVHGAFGGAWVWAEHLMPYLARRGRRVAAVSLRGHGGSEGIEGLRATSLADFDEDIRRAAEAMPAPPVLVGHSLGGLLAQRAVGRLRLGGLALMGSLPPEGLAFEGPRLALAEPTIWTEGLLGSLAKARAPVSDAHWRLLFSEDLPLERAARYAARMRPESIRALGEAHWPGPILPAALAGLPAMVVGGGADRLVLPLSFGRTAFYHGADLRMLERAGHFLMLDPDAESAARILVDWLAARGL
jgi:pimeloyl-ACP methyl ester carboxylesterase